MSDADHPSNPLALAVLALLFERDMHPYEMAATMKERGKEKSIKLRYGSLYTVIAALQRDGLIVPRETVRAGRRPERTVFAITPAGTETLTRWMTAMLARPAKEYPLFEAGLSLMPVLAPEAVAPLLEQRLARLDAAIAESRAELARAAEADLPALFLVEHEYELAMLETERRFVAGLAGRIRDGSLEGLALWRGWHAEREARP
ncbi:PadR family transcriptional regulator [Inquilinus sp.]|uniref:PadR family transcriptional regulator n=1 Tax=Inquilinus sp. TaxID=1932117 RepID=UPI0031D9BAFE